MIASPASGATVRSAYLPVASRSGAAASTAFSAKGFATVAAAETASAALPAAPAAAPNAPSILSAVLSMESKSVKRSCGV